MSIMVLYTAPPGKMTIPDGLLINYLFVWFYFREPEKKKLCVVFCVCITLRLILKKYF